MFVIPTKDTQKVVDPQRMDTLPPEGRDVGGDHPEYWERRRQDGDITVVPADQVGAARTKAAAAEATRNEEVAKAQKDAAEAANPPQVPAKGQK